MLADQAKISSEIDGPIARSVLGYFTCNVNSELPVASFPPDQPERLAEQSRFQPAILFSGGGITVGPMFVDLEFHFFPACIHDPVFGNSSKEPLTSRSIA